MKSNDNRALAELNEKLLERKEAERTKYKIALNDRDRNYAHGMMLAYGQAAAMVRERMAECSDENSVLPIQRVNGWLDFQSNKELFNEEAKKNCLCKFEDGTVIRYDEEHPLEIMTHFKLAEACS